MNDQTYARMTHHERARALAGDMPWITAGLAPGVYTDFVAQLEATFKAVAWQAVIDAIDNAPDLPKPGPKCAECGADMNHSRLYGYTCSVNPRHDGIAK